VAPIIAKGIKSQANVLFEEGVQHSFLSTKMASELQISPTTQTDIEMALFGSTSMTHQKLGVATIEVETLYGELIPILVLIMPSIAALHIDFCSQIRHLKLAHPLTSIIMLLIVPKYIHHSLNYFHNFIFTLVVKLYSKTLKY